MTISGYIEDMTKTRSAIAAGILLSLVGCVHDQGGVTQQIYEVVGGIAYLGAEAWQVFLLVP